MTKEGLLQDLKFAWTNRKSDIREAFYTAQELILKCESLNFEKGIAESHKVLGYCYWRFSEFSLSMEHSLKALDFFQKEKDLGGEADTLNSLGAVYMFQKEHQKRLECNLKCLEIRVKLGNADEISGSINNIGETYLEMGDYTSAKKRFIDCINYPKSTNDSIAWACHNLGKLYFIENDYSNSEKSFLESLSLSEEIKYDVLSTETFLQLSKLHKALGNVKNAMDYASSALRLATETGAKEEQKNARLFLSELKEINEDYKGSLTDFKIYHQLFSEIHNESNIQSLKNLEFQYELENMRKEAEIERFKAVELKAAFDQIDSQKSLLEQKNKEIMESIRYAQGIQQAILKEEKHVSEHLPEHFIYYRPKDIVSGDFYWAHEKDGVLYVAAADCTGHGVPGGFLTMLGIAFLNEIISKNDKMTPAQILNELHEKFIKELRLQNSTSDGMDITLVSMRYDDKSETKELMWAGAYNPLWVVKKRNQKNLDTKTNLSKLIRISEESEIEGLELFEIKPDKQPIGRGEDHHDFTNHTINLDKEDILYLFSDGFQDQFGGSDGKKLKRSGFKDLILSLAKQPLENQLMGIENFFDSWKGDLEQVDDVCVIGIKL